MTMRNLPNIEGLLCNTWQNVIQDFTTAANKVFGGGCR